MAQLSYLRHGTKTFSGPLPSGTSGPCGATHPSWYGLQETTLRTNVLRRAPRCSTGEVPKAQ
eukprot:1259545-Prymnesium_polylepis.1